MRFRCSPLVQLKRLDELGVEQRAAFLELESDPDFYGLFVPRPPLTMNLKSVARQTAELFQALTTPSRLDGALLADAESVDDVIDLVLDGILEIESGDGFVSGADALPLVSEPTGEVDAGGAVAGLSRQALMYAEDLEASDLRTLTTALYIYNRIPASPFWKARFASQDDVLAHVGAGSGSLRALLEQEWVASGSTAGWLSWVLEEVGAAERGRRDVQALRQPAAGAHPRRFRDRRTRAFRHRRRPLQARRQRRRSASSR